MNAMGNLFRPVGLGIAVTGTALSALALLGMGVASITARWTTFGVGIGVVLIVYGLLVGAGAYLGMKRVPLARGMMVAPALLHLASAASFATSNDVPQRIGSGLAGVFFVVVVAAALLPSTRRALMEDEMPPGTDGR